MRVWVRLEELQSWRKLTATSWRLGDFCPHCEIRFTDNPGERDRQLIDGMDCVWLTQACQCDSVPILITSNDTLIDIHKENIGFTPLAFIELSEYDNYSFLK